MVGRQAIEGGTMADRLLCISWGEVVRGREELALEAFNTAVGFYGRKQQEGRIERFDVRLLAPQARVGGYMELEASAEQIAALKEDPEFQRNFVNASLCVDDLRMNDGYCNQGVADQMALFTEAVSKVPQSV
jgi:hypothetical protein